MLHKIKLITKGTTTQIFLDDKEVHGCVSASIDYEANAVPFVRLELASLDIEVEAEEAEVNENNL